MIVLNFTKMNGAGNDFIMIDNRDSTHTLNHHQIAKLCDRHRGIGADGVLIVEHSVAETSDKKNLPIQMRYYNADGYEAEMCGNGARCFTRYVAKLLGQKSGVISFETKAGLLQGEILENQVRLLMSQPHSLQLGHSLQLLDQERTVHSINTGVPHAVVFVEDINNIMVTEEGRALRYHPRFAPAGTNVNFVQILSPHSLSIRTYERGVEGETLACGTGVVAAALIHHLLSDASAPLSVVVAGGDTLEVNFTTSPPASNNGCSCFLNVTLTGPADLVFNGTILL